MHNITFRTAISDKPHSFTENGALSLSTTGSARVNLFFKLTRDAYINSLFYNWIESSWNEDPLDTMKTLFHGRDARGGKGDRKSFIMAMGYIYSKHYDWWKANIEIVPIYGRYLDLIELYVVDNNLTIANIICEQLKKDLDDMNNGKSISLLAKWIPSEGKKWNRKNNILGDICRILFKVKDYDIINNWHYKELRTKYLTPLRAYLNIVESYMCSGRWEDIDFSKVPSVAMHRLKNAFARNAHDAFTEWKKKLIKGQVKVNSSQIDIHKLVKQCMVLHSQDEVIEAQWKDILTKTKALGTLENTIVLSDVSGSMDGTPMEVSIALGILISSITAEPFKNTIITFSESPTVHIIPEDYETLFDKVNSVKNMSWGYNTDLNAVFTLILDRAIHYNLSQDTMPKRIIILSDMQFDEAVGLCDNSKTIFDEIDNMYLQAGFKRPDIVFWNLRSNTTSDFPVEYTTNGVALVSGYNVSIIKSLLESDNFTPYNVYRNIIDNPRYDLIKSPSE